MLAYQDLFDLQRTYFLKKVKNSSASARKQKLIRLKKWIKQHQTDIGNAIYKDFGKAPFETHLTELLILIKSIDYTIANLPVWMQSKHITSPYFLTGIKSWIRYEPKGQVLVISPWNFPFILAVNPVVSAIAAGNCVILKPSELSTHCSAIIQQMFSELFDTQEVAVVQGGAEVAAEWLKLPFNHIFFTGSPRVGKIVMKAAADNLSSITLELGGQNPAIVHQSANLKTTVERLLWSKYLNAAQSCVSPNYVFIHRSIYAEFIILLKQKLEWFQSVSKQDYQMTGIINDYHFGRIKKLAEQGVDSGAKLINPFRYDKEKRKIEPFFLSDTEISNPVMKEEIFGPVLPLIVYDHIDELLALIHSKPIPLALYIFSKNNSFTKEIINKTSSGTIMINDTTLQFTNHKMPFGGANHSGIGKAHGYAGFLAFSNQRSVMKQNSNFSLLRIFYPPYTAWKQKILNIITWKI